MKIIQMPFCFYPDPVGGTEIYVEALSKNLQSRGADVLVVCAGPKNTDYSHNGLRVRRFAVSTRLNLNQLYGKTDPLAMQGFRRILEEERPDIVHMHLITSASSVESVIAAKRIGAKVFFTYHTPGTSCQRGSLMYRGKSACTAGLYCIDVQGARCRV